MITYTGSRVLFVVFAVPEPDNGERDPVTLQRPMSSIARMCSLEDGKPLAIT